MALTIRSLNASLNTTAAALERVAESADKAGQSLSRSEVLQDRARIRLQEFEDKITAQQPLFAGYLDQFKFYVDAMLEAQAEGDVTVTSRMRQMLNGIEQIFRKLGDNDFNADQYLSLLRKVESKTKVGKTVKGSGSEASVSGNTRISFGSTQAGTPPATTSTANSLVSTGGLK